MGNEMHVIENEFLKVAVAPPACATKAGHCVNSPSDQSSGML